MSANCPSGSKTCCSNLSRPLKPLRIAFISRKLTGLFCSGYNPEPMDWAPLWISIATSVTATAITLFLGLAAAAWREGRKGPAMALVDGVFLLPLVLPPTVVGFLSDSCFLGGTCDRLENCF